MSSPMRILLLAAAILLFVFMLRSIKKSKMRIDDCLFWVLFTLLILLLGIFPDIAMDLAFALGVQSPVNFVFLFFIGVLLLRDFALNRRISQLENKVAELAEQTAVNQLDHYERARAARAARDDRAARAARDDRD